MRIGVISGEYPPLLGGVGAYTHIMVGQWLKMGHQVYLFTPPHAQENRPNTHTTHYAGKWGIDVVGQVRQWAKTHQLEVILLQSQMGMYNLSGVMTALPFLMRVLMRSVPFITTFHDLLPPYLFPKAGGLRTWAMRQMARYSAHTVVTNDEDLHSLASLKNVSLIPIGSNITVHTLRNNTRQTLRQRVGGEFIVGHFGFLYTNRGVEHLLTALKACRVYHDVRLVMIGGREGGPTDSLYVARLDADIARLGLNEAVHWTGYATNEEVSAWLQSIDCVALPFLDGASYRRGSLMAAIEHACPILTTQHHMSVQAFQDGVNMQFVPVGDAKALENALLAWITAPNELAQYRQNLSTLRQKFQWDSITEDFERVLKEVT